MKLSGRDKKLIIVLGIIAVILLPGFFIAKPLYDRITDTKEEIKTLQERYNYLNNLFGQISTFRQGTQEYKVQIVDIVDKFPADIRQENTIMFLLETERNLPIALYQVAFSATDSTPIGTVSSDLSTVMETTEKLGQDYTGIHTAETIGYRVPYADFKRFINYIEQWEDRLTISNLSATYNVEEDEVAGSFTINQYAILSEGRVLEEANTNVDRGTHNIFSADGEEWEDWLDEEEDSMNGGEIVRDDEEEPETTKEPDKQEKDQKDNSTSDNKTSDNKTTDNKTSDSSNSNNATVKGYDVYFMLNQPQSEADAMIVGYTNDTTNKYTIKSDRNRSRLARFTFEEEDGKIYVTYKLSYKIEKHEITPDGDIVLNIYSSSRAGRDDLIESSVAVVNNTKKTVQVNIINDDEEDPRIDIREKSGKVVINN